jgi:hypothetical protein
LFWNKIKARLPEIILLGAVGFLQFFRLGIGEFQPWDESLYLIRAEAIQKFGCWLDQTQYAIGGLYSSTHPPLAIWMMTLVRMAFGNSTFVSRSIAASCAVAAIYFFYRLASRLFSRWTALFASIALGSAQHFIWYSHHAQLDIPMFACIMAASYFAIRTYEEGSSKYAIITGMLFACALLCKAVQGLYLLPFLLALPYIFRGNKRYINLIIILGVTIIIALPWYLFIFLRHPEFAKEYTALVASMKTGTYAGTLSGVPANQWWYYLNQTVINFPFIILGVLAIIPLVRIWKHRDMAYARMSLIVFFWFCAMIIFLSFFATRMLHFSLFLLLPTSLLIAFFIEEFLQLPVKRRKIITAVILLLAVLGWSGSELIRKGIREHAIPDLHSVYIFIVVMFICSAIFSWFLYKRFHLTSPVILLLIVSCFCVSADYYRWATREKEAYIDGANETAAMLLHTPQIHSLIAYQSGSAHEAFLPQLNYYTEGWLMGWDTTKQGTTKTWDEIDSLIKVDQAPKSDAAIIYVSWDAFYSPTEDEKEHLIRINKGLSHQYTNSLHTKKYQLYWGAK